MPKTDRYSAIMPVALLLTLAVGLLLGYAVSTRVFHPPQNAANQNTNTIPPAITQALENSDITWRTFHAQLPDACVGALANEPLWMKHLFLYELSFPGDSFMNSDGESSNKVEESGFTTGCIVIVANGLYGGQLGMGSIDPVTGTCTMGYPYSDTGAWEGWWKY
jgi:hypothetical protein